MAERAGTDVMAEATLQQFPDDRPSVAQLRAWRDQLDAEFGGLEGAAEDDASVYYQDFAVESYGEALQVKTGSAPSDANAAIDSLVPAEILIRCKPARAREKYRKKATKKELMARAWLADQRQPKDPLEALAADMVIRRRGVARVLTDLSGWPTLPTELERPDFGEPPVQADSEDEGSFQQRYDRWNAPVQAWQDQVDDWELQNRRGMPIILERRDCRYVRWREIRGELLVVTEKYEATVLEAYSTFSSSALRPAVERALKGRTLDEKVWVSDIWYKQWRCVLIDDQPIFPQRGVMEHGYPGIPYIIAPFREVPADDPEERYRGMLTDAKLLYKIESSVLIMHIQMLRWNAWRTWTYWLQDPTQTINMVPGQGMRLNKAIGEYIDIPNSPSVPPEVMQTVAAVDAYIQRNSVAQGPRTAEGTRSAQQLWAIEAQRSQKIEPAQRSMTALLYRALELFSWQAENLLKTYGGELTLPVPGRDHAGNDIGEVTLRANDIDGYYGGWVVKFGKRLDPALLQQAEALMTMAGNKWMPRRMSVELSGMTDNVQEWMDELLEEQVESLPFLMEASGLERLANWYGEDSEQYQQTFAKVMAGHQAPPPPPPQMQPAHPKGPVTTSAGVGATISKMGTQRAARPTGKTSGMPRRPRGSGGQPPA